MTTKTHKILIVDDHPIVREGFVTRISQQADLEICGEAAGVDEAMEQVRTTKPDLVLVDLNLKTGHGLDLIKQIKAHNDRIKILVVSMLEESLFAERAFRSGAMGYINKQEAADKIIEAIRKILAGKIYISAEGSQLLFQRFLGKEPGQDESLIAPLSDREVEIFELLGHGQTARQIANQLHLSVRTVESHRGKIKSKLGMSSSAELNRQALLWVMQNQKAKGISE